MYKNTDVREREREHIPALCTNGESKRKERAITKKQSSMREAIVSINAMAEGLFWKLNQVLD